jgi:tetratricopeptide (TPR) repeat protein
MKNGASALAALLVLAACGGNDGLRDDQATGSIDSAAWRQAQDLPAGVREALDSGNAAYRAGNYEAAREQYERAIELGPEETAGWFGLSMVEGALGNAAAADSAMQRVRDLTPNASLVEPGPGAPPNPHP